MGKAEGIGESGYRKLHSIALELSNFFKEREELIKLTILALLSRQHIYILGPPGTAKSAVARAIASHFNARYFEWLVTRFTTPEELFGPIDLAALEKGEYRRITANKLPEAEIAFVDEIFKANSAILNSLLAIINERIYHDNGMVIRVPLNTLIAASNELPEDERELAALYDRLLIRYTVGYIKDDASFEEMLKGGEEYTPKTRITMDELKVMQGQVAGIDISRVIPSIVQLRKSLRESGIVVSDRRFKQSISVIKAHAFFSGRSAATIDDLRVLQHIMWDTPEQIRAVRAVIMDAVDPFARKVMEYRDIISDYSSRLQGRIDAAEIQEIMAKLKVVENEIKELSRMAVSSGRDTAELDEILDEIQSLKMSMLDKMF
ncbi:ATPase associated with various cellular activities AAA_5 [Ferroglobus placidus DSM 10642]|uniref:ATPase associated with various cellular activities AAA_5 n=1 Tax=Ferroglobus placidus (strain DSM 10642 / AEDII12DO) TaxID=589924 RepID=D3S354_FERPA|nr:AAA family ATPase [Ferroglobus placidus]ADC64687.1 ATPase associated with various cellular activities AAA_5 [Ferroglobus placidus DSM 10642]